MKKIFKIAVSLTLTIGLFSSLACANAISARTSQYLNTYVASISAGRNGTIAITARVVGKGSLDEIGVSSIAIYESSDGRNYAHYGTFYSSDYPSMMGSGAFYDQKAFEFTGTIENTYKATVYCYGADDSGSDSKPYYTSPVTARR